MRGVVLSLPLVASVLMGGALAQEVPSEIVRYNDVVVTFSENAKECNLSDAALLAERVHDKLTAIGLERTDESALFVNLGVSGKSFGVLGVQCASQTELRFQTVLPAANITTDNANVRAALDRLESIPIILYRTGQFGVQKQVQPAKGGPSTSSQEAVLVMIDKMVETFDEARGQ